MGTAQNSAGNGPGTVLKTAVNIQFSGTSLAKGSGAAIADLIAEFRTISDVDQIFLEVPADDGLSATDAAAQIAKRKVSLVQGMKVAGFVVDAGALLPNASTVAFREAGTSTFINPGP